MGNPDTVPIALDRRGGSNGLGNLVSGNDHDAAKAPAAGDPRPRVLVGRVGGIGIHVE